MRDGDSSKLKKSNKTRQSKEANEIHILKGWVEHLISLYHSKISVMNQAYKEMEDFKLHDEQLYWITICIEHSSIPYLIVKIKKAKGQTNRKYNKIKRHSYLWRLWRGTSILLTCHLWIDFPRDLIINEWEMEAFLDIFESSPSCWQIQFLSAMILTIFIAVLHWTYSSDTTWCSWHLSMSSFATVFSKFSSQWCLAINTNKYDSLIARNNDSSEPKTIKQNTATKEAKKRKGS